MDDPTWLRRALAVEPDQAWVDVDGCRISVALWGNPGAPGLVLVHGGAAHNRWWSHVAPMLPGYRIAALDLSGHGDSDRRDEYSLDRWTDEVMAAAALVGDAGPPVVIGHSMGGFVSTATAVAAGDRLTGIIVLDSPMVSDDPEVEAARIGHAFGGSPRVYATLDEARARFRTVPGQAHYDPVVFDHVARHSLAEVDGGWTWRFDRRIFAAVSRSAAAELLPHVSCRVALLRAEHGLVTPEIGSIMYERLGRVAPVVEIPEAGHHLMLDQPMLLIVALRALLADWEHSIPVRR